MRGEVSIGLPGALDAEAVRALAPRVEAAGFAGLWLNDTPQGDSIAGLAVAAAVTTHLRLATGVVPVDRRPATSILDSIRSTGLPEARLTLGIGSGQGARGAVDRVRGATQELRGGTSAAIVVGALGPRMRALAAEEADGVLLSWLTPGAAREQAREARDTGRRADGEVPRVALYARTIVDPAARAVLEHEARQYASYPAYAANLARLGIQAIETTLPRPGDADAAPGVAAYLESVDDLVLRAITPSGAVEELESFIDRAAELIR